MLSLRLFPSFEKPVERRRHLNLHPERRGYGGIAAVLAFAGLCGFLLALPDRSQVPPGPARVAAAATISKPVKNITAVAPEDPAKLSALCNDRPTARRACADAKAARDARLAQALAPAGAKSATARPSSRAAVQTGNAATAGSAARAEADPADEEQPVVAAPRKPKAPRADDSPVERLVHVYDHIAPDGRRVPVYRRADGGYEFGAVVDGEYRRTQQAEIARPRAPSFFGLQ